MDDINILLVDDEELLLESTKLYLEKMSERFHIQTLLSAEEAIDLLKRKEFDVIISDYQMPEMSGLDFLAYLRERDNETPFIIFTGRGREEVAIQALNLGGDYYLQKGGDAKSQFRELVNLIEKLVEKKQAVLARNRLLEQQISINKLALTLGESLDLEQIYKSIYQHIISLMAADAFVVSFYDKESNTVTPGYISMEGRKFDPSIFPQRTISDKDNDAESYVIKNRKALYLPDLMKGNDDQKPKIKEFGAVEKPKVSEQNYTRSAIYAPMKFGGEIIGIIQVQSYHFDAYTEEDIDLLTALANVAASTIQNARLYEQQKQTNIALRKERNRAQNYLNIAGMILVAIDINGTVKMINKRGCEILGYPEKEIIGKDWVKSFIPTNEQRSFQSILQKILSAEFEKYQTFEMPLKTLHLGDRIIKWRTTVIESTEESDVSILSSGIDITEEIEALESLEKSEKRYELMVENINDGLTILENNKITFVNKRICEITGYSREELLNITFRELLAPEEIERMAKVYQRWTAGQEELSELTFWIIRKNGERRYIRNRYSYIYINEVRYQYILTTDITKQHKAEKNLLESENKYEVTINSMNVPLHVANEDLTIVLHNKAMDDWLESLGIDSNIDNKHVRKAFPFLPKSVEDEYQEMKINKEPVISQDSTTLKGREIITETRKFPIIQNDQVVGIITLLTDITQQKQIERQLLESEEKFHSIANQSFIGIVIVVDDELIFVNEAADKITGYKLTQMKIISKSFFRKVIPEEDLEAIRSSFEERNKKGGEGLLSQGNIRFITSEGERKWLLISSSPILYKNKPGLVFVFTDNTEQFKAIENLTRSQQKFQSIFHNNKDGIVLIDQKDNIVDANIKIVELLQYPKSELLKKKFTNLLSRDDRERFSQSLSSIKSQGFFEIHCGIQKKDKSFVLVGIKINRILIGNRFHYMAFIEDLSQERQAILERAKFVHDLSLLSESAMKLVSITSKEEIYQFIAEKIHTLVGESIVVVTDYNNQNKTFTIQSIFGLHSRFDRRVLSKEKTFQTNFTLDEDSLQRLSRDELIKINSPLHKLSDLVSAREERKLRKAYNLKEKFVVPFINQNQMHGLVIIMLQEDNELTNRERLKAFVNQAAVALLRIGAEEELQESEKRYRSLFNESNDGIIIFDENDKIIDINKKGQEILHTNKDITNHKITSIIPTNKHEFYFSEKKELLQKSHAKFDLPFIISNNESLIAELSAKVYQWHDKQLIQAVFRDVSDRRLLEEQKAQYISELRILSQTALDLLRMTMDDNIYRFIGEKIRELAGESIVVVSSFAEETDTFYAEAIIGVSNHLTTIAKIIGLDPYQMNVTIKRKYIEMQSGGHIHQIDTTLNDLTDGMISKKMETAINRLIKIKEMYAISFVVDEKLFGTVLIVMRNDKIHNIALIETFANQAAVALLRRKAEKELLASKRKYQYLVETMSDGLITTNNAELLTFVNNRFCEMLDYQPADLLGHPIKEFLDKKSYDLYQDCPEGEKTVTGELVWINKDNQKIPTLCSTKAIYDAEDNILGRIEVITDITELKKYEQELEKQRLILEKQRDELSSFASTVAHDIRGKLQIISLYNDMNEYQARTEKIDQVLKEISQFLDDQLLLAKRGDILGQIKKIDLLDLIDEIIQKVRKLKPELEIITKPLPKIKGDPIKLHQVFENIFMNVVKHSEATVLTIYSESDQNYDKIIIEDNGIGIDAERRREIKESSGQYRFTTFGFSIVDKIIKAHQGLFLIESEKEQGTKVILAFPKK
jgi:PAS domain S-box-containing protein